MYLGNKFQMIKRVANVNHVGWIFLKKDKASDTDVPVKCKTVRVDFLFFYWKGKLVLPGLTMINNTSQEAANEFQDQTKGLDSMD